MAQKRLSSWQKATALVPLALLSCAWTATLTATGITPVAAKDPGATTLPDGTTVPDQALEAPASVTTPGSLAAGVPAGATRSIVNTVSSNGIPAAALAAYQRADQVINSADPSCKVSWQLIAAIGRVESDHGRYGGNTVDDEGRSVPGIYGITLDGSNGTAKIVDSDAGQLDDDRVHDRAVGPMQFIPGTWQVVGVDGDGDGVRDPQDVDDAALATAVYLCSGDEDLSTTAGQRSAVYRYNHNRAYVDLVLSIMAAYLGGDFSAVPNGVAAPVTFSPSTTSGTATPDARRQKTDRPEKNRGGTHPGGTESSGDGDGGGSTPSGGSGGGTSDNDTGDDGGTQQAPPEPDPVEPPPAPKPAPPTDPVKETTDKVKETVEDTTDTVQKPVEDTTDTVEKPVKDTLTRAEATQQCLDSGISKLQVDALAECVDDLLS